MSGVTCKKRLLSQLRTLSGAKLAERPTRFDPERAKALNLKDAQLTVHYIGFRPQPIDNWICI
jgi:hypothetical protein